MKKIKEKNNGKTTNTTLKIPLSTEKNYQAAHQSASCPHKQMEKVFLGIQV